MSKYTKKKIGSDKLRKMREETRLNAPMYYEMMHERSVKSGIVFHAIELMYWKLEAYANTINKCFHGLVISDQLKSVRQWLNRAVEDLNTSRIIMNQHYVENEKKANAENCDDYIWLSECIDTVMGFDDEGNYVKGKSIAIVDNKILPLIDPMVVAGTIKKEEFKCIFNQVKEEEVDASYDYKPTKSAKKQA